MPSRVTSASAAPRDSEAPSTEARDERAIRAHPQDIDRLGVRRRHHQIGNAVAIEVTGGNVEGSRAHRDLVGRQKAAGLYRD